MRSGDERTQPEKKQGADKDIGREKERTRIEGLIRQRRLLERDDISGFGHFVDSCGLKRGHGCYKLFLGELGFDGEILILAYHSVEIALLRAEARQSLLFLIQLALHSFQPRLQRFCCRSAGTHERLGFRQLRTQFDGFTFQFRHHPLQTSGRHPGVEEGMRIPEVTHSFLCLPDARLRPLDFRLRQ